MVTTYILLALVLFVFLFRKRKPRNIPPGPRGLPLLGNTLDFLGKNKIDVLESYRKKYGDICSVNLLGNLVIVISGQSTLKDALVKNSHVFSDRPTSMMRAHTKGCGLVGTSGAKWKEIKYFTLSALKEFGFGKMRMETRIQEEMKYFLEEIEKKNGQPFQMKYILQNAVSNVICSLVFGHRFEYSDERFNRLMEMMRLRFHTTDTISLLYFFPLVKYFIPKKMSSLKQTENAVWEIYKLIEEEIQTHEETFDEKNLRDFTDVFLKEIKTRKHETATNFTVQQLLVVSRELFMAGTETVASTLLWALVYLVRNPSVQSRVRQEINDTIGKDSLPSYSHLSKLPFTEATLHEIQRIGDVTPHSIIHATSSDVKFIGYDIPKGTPVIPNLHSVLCDGEIWNDPESFNPDRFLGSDGKLLKQKVDNMIPFSIGRRACIGESLAKMELFLFLTTMLQRFEFRAPEGEIPKLDSIYGVTRSPVDFRIQATQCY